MSKFKPVIDTLKDNKKLVLKVIGVAVITLTFKVGLDATMYGIKKQALPLEIRTGATFAQLSNQVENIRALASQLKSANVSSDDILNYFEDINTKSDEIERELILTDSDISAIRNKDNIHEQTDKANELIDKCLDVQKKMTKDLKGLGKNVDDTRIKTEETTRKSENTRLSEVLNYYSKDITFIDYEFQTQKYKDWENRFSTELNSIKNNE